MWKSNIPYGITQDLVLTSTGTTYSNVLDFSNYESARQIELKCNVTAWNWTLVLTIQTSDDNVVWFSIPSATDTLSSVDSGGAFASAVWRYMRVQMTYTHVSTNTEWKLYLLVR